MNRGESRAAKSFTWRAIDRLVRRVARAVEKDGYRPEVIVGIMRGGCIPAVCLSHLLNVRATYVIRVQTTLTDDVRAPRVTPTMEAQCDPIAFLGRRVLLVDDVTNTGETLRVAISYVRSHVPADLRTAVLVWDTAGIPPESGVRCEADYSGSTVGAWAIFPWEQSGEE